MENWGVISYQESGLLYDKYTASTFDQERVATLIARELAHQVNSHIFMIMYYSSLTKVYIKLDISVNVIVNLDVQ